MTARQRYQDVEIGSELPQTEFQVQLVDEIRYCGAGLDFVGVHWNERVAQSVGMPHVVAHGPLTEAKALSVVNEWTGDPTAVIEHHARFHRPVLLPDYGVGAVFLVGGAVTQKLEGNRVEISLQVASVQGEELANVRVLVQLGHV
jgi:acyl dehydratase